VVPKEGGLTTSATLAKTEAPEIICPLAIKAFSAFDLNPTP
jgi:hypothetical protein